MDLSPRRLLGRLARRVGLRSGDPRAIFSRIYANGAWRHGETLSGAGSSLERTEAVRAGLAALLERLGVTSLVDAPCGDLNWISRVDLGRVRYVGVDIVPQLIEDNRRRHPDRAFQVGDIVKDPLPAADAVLCRDALIHLSNEDGVRALANIRRSGARYLLATTHEKVQANVPIDTGEWRNVNLELAPFLLPRPTERIVENEATGKLLGVWELRGDS